MKLNPSLRRHLNASKKTSSFKLKDKTNFMKWTKNYNKWTIKLRIKAKILKRKMAIRMVSRMMKRTKRIRIYSKIEMIVKLTQIKSKQ